MKFTIEINKSWENNTFAFLILPAFSLFIDKRNQEFECILLLGFLIFILEIKFIIDRKQ